MKNSDLPCFVTVHRFRQPTGEESCVVNTPANSPTCSHRKAVADSLNVSQNPGAEKLHKESFVEGYDFTGCGKMQNWVGRGFIPGNKANRIKGGFSVCVRTRCSPVFCYRANGPLHNSPGQSASTSSSGGLGWQYRLGPRAESPTHPVLADSRSRRTSSHAVTEAPAVCFLPIPRLTDLFPQPV